MIGEVEMNHIQCRMARAALGWSSTRPARASRVSITAMNGYLMNGEEMAPDDTARVRSTFEAHRVAFTNDASGIGVHLAHEDSKPSFASSGPATDVVATMDAAIVEHEGRALTIEAENLNSSNDD